MEECGVQYTRSISMIGRTVTKRNERARQQQKSEQNSRLAREREGDGAREVQGKNCKITRVLIELDVDADNVPFSPCQMLCIQRRNFVRSFFSNKFY